MRRSLPISRPAQSSEGPHGEACITCGDVAVQVRVVELMGPTAVIEKDGAFEQVAIDLVEHVAVGDLLLCHAGVALEKVED
jgi:hydrogenase maturation factor